jgi:hypothetical protein
MAATCTCDCTWLAYLNPVYPNLGRWDCVIYNSCEGCGCEIPPSGAFDGQVVSSSCITGVVLTPTPTPTPSWTPFPTGPIASPPPTPTRACGTCIWGANEKVISNDCSYGCDCAFPKPADYDNNNIAFNIPCYTVACRGTCEWGVERVQVKGKFKTKFILKKQDCKKIEGYVASCKECRFPLDEYEGRWDELYRNIINSLDFPVDHPYNSIETGCVDNNLYVPPKPPDPWEGSQCSGLCRFKWIDMPPERRNPLDLETEGWDEIVIRNCGGSNCKCFPPGEWEKDKDGSWTWKIHKGLFLNQIIYKNCSLNTDPYGNKYDGGATGILVPPLPEFAPNQNPNNINVVMLDKNLLLQRTAYAISNSDGFKLINNLAVGAPIDFMQDDITSVLPLVKQISILTDIEV